MKYKKVKLIYSKERKSDIRDFKCFKCVKLGHYARDCYSNDKKNIVNKKNEEDLDMRYLMLNDVKIKTLFNSGSSINIITKGIFNRLKNLRIDRISNGIKIKLLNGSCIESK
ncbi:hypothetical protein DMUE_0845 [Dictyocoela muelleri]|nr:hypothetical protein DMUE_0845 [Dictyocoela muelleri]